MKKILAVLIALTMVFGLAIVPSFADPTKPTSHDEATSHPGITSVTVAGTSAIFETDDNTGSAIYIRATLPSGTTGGKTEYELRNATVVISTNGIAPSVYYGNTYINPTSVIQDEDEYTYTLDLLNKVYTVTISSTNYTLAAGIDDGSVAVSSSDPLRLEGYLDNSDNPITTFGSCQNNPYMGNPYYSSGWTFISYFFSATLPSGTSTGDVPGSLTVANGATLSTTASALHSNYYDFSSGHNATVTNSGVSRVYYPRLSVTNGTISISRSNYDFNFTELKADTTYYTSTVAGKVEEIEKAWSAFLTDSTATTFNSGATAMDVVTRFINWAETHYVEGTTPYFTGTSETSSGTYLSKLDGLDASDCGYMAGYMYAIEPYRWVSSSDHSAMGTVGADGYTLSNSTYVVWFYTTDFTRWFNW